MNQQAMDLLTSFGPTLLAGVMGSQQNKVDPAARGRNDLANILEVLQNSSTFGAETAQTQFNNLFNTRQTMGSNAVEDAGAPYGLMNQSQQARLRAAIGPQLAGMFGVNVNLPANAFDIDSRMGSDQFLAERLNQLAEGSSMRSPLSTPMNLGTMAGAPGQGMQSSLAQFNNSRRNEFTSGEKDLNNSLMNAVAGYQGAANDYVSGVKNMQQQEAKKSEGGGGLWKKLLGIGALAAMPFTGGLSGALAGATGMGTGLATGLVGAGLGAASAAGAGANPLLGAVAGGAGNALFGPGGKYGKPLNTSVAKTVGTTANKITGSRSALDAIYNTKER